MATIHDLPLSLLLDIGDVLDFRSLNAFSRTSSYYYSGLNRYLYKLHIRHDEPKDSCLFWAAKAGRLDTIKMAHLYGADLNIERETYRDPPSPLHTAIRSLHPHIVEYILRNGGTVHSPAWKYGMARPYPLGKALTTRNLKEGPDGVKKNQMIVDMLIRHGATLVDELEPALPRAAALNKREVVTLLLEQPAVCVNDATRKGLTALQMASQNGHTELARYLLDQPGIDIYAASEDGKTALMVAIENGHLDILRQLVMWCGLTRDAAFELTKEAFEQALIDGQPHICEYLLTRPGIHGEMTLRDGCTALHLAARSKNVDTVKLLLEQTNVNVAAVNLVGETALHCLASEADSTARVKRAYMAKLLVERGAPVNQADFSELTPLERAIKTNNFQVAIQLLHCGADFTRGTESESGDYTWTLAHECLSQTTWKPWMDKVRAAMIETLIKFGPASIHKASKVPDRKMQSTRTVPFDGTPLLFAILYDREPATIQMLIDNGARIDSVATKRDADASNCRHSILQALLSVGLPAGYPSNGASTVFSATEGDVASIEERMEILLSNGARIDPEYGLQSVLEYACELYLATHKTLLRKLLNKATLMNVSLEHVHQLLLRYLDKTEDGTRNALADDLVMKLEKWVDMGLMPDEMDGVVTTQNSSDSGSSIIMDSDNLFDGASQW